MPEAALNPLADPYTGLISRLSVVEMNPGDPSVFLVNAKLANVEAYGLPRGAGGHGGAGAGLTLESATWAALGEAVERYALAYVPEETICASVRELRRDGAPVCDAAEWTLFDRSQYGAIAFRPFDDDTPIAWVPAHDLTDDVESYVPCCLTFMPYAPRHPGERVIGYAISTGAAAAPAPAEAALRGILEIVERDAFMIVWRNRLPCPRIAIDDGSVLDEIVRQRFRRPGLSYSLFLTALDLPFCSVFGILRDDSGPQPRMTVGGACHLDAREAVRKTCLELVQGMKWLEYMDDPQFPVEPRFANVRQFEDRIRLYGFNRLDEAFAFLDAGGGVVPLSGLPATVDRDPLRHVCAVLKDAGLCVYAKDITPPDVRASGLSVVKVLIPQAEPMEGDFSLELLGGRRWRRVPVLTGRRGRELALGERNSFPHPYP